jgi:carboxymethylenebutenolidase
MGGAPKAIRSCESGISGDFHPQVPKPDSIHNQQEIPAMIRTLFAMIATATLTTSGLAQEWAKTRLENSPRHLEWVTITNEGRALKCFVAYPEVKDKATAVIVIHEIFGLTDWVRGVTDQLAEAGYIAIAPDFLSGSATNGGGSAELGGGDAVRRAISSLKPEQITGDLNAAVAYATSLPACNGKVTVGGFCWGGTQTFRFATNNKQIKAGFAFYGSGPDKAEDIARIECPIYGFYGGNDNRVNSTIPKSTELMKAAQKTYEPVTYEGAGHGFMRAGEAPDANEANKKAREEAWKRWKEILGKI